MYFCRYRKTKRKLQIVELDNCADIPEMSPIDPTVKNFEYLRIGSFINPRKRVYSSMTLLLAKIRILEIEVQNFFSVDQEKFKYPKKAIFRSDLT